MNQNDYNETWPPPPACPTPPVATPKPKKLLTGRLDLDIIAGLASGVAPQFLLLHILSGRVPGWEHIAFPVMYRLWAVTIILAAALFALLIRRYPTLSISYAVGTLPLALFTLFWIFIADGMSKMD